MSPTTTTTARITRATRVRLRIAGQAIGGVIVSAALLMAQTPANRPAAPDRPDAAAQEVKATGCLERADQVGSPPESASTQAAPDRSAPDKSAPETPKADAQKRAGVATLFVLSGARIGGVGVASSVMPSVADDDDRPRTEAPQRSATTARLRVSGLGASELQAHVNQQVELQGRLQHQAPGATTPTSDVGTPANTRTTGTPGTSGTTGSGTPNVRGTTPGPLGQAAAAYAPTFVATSIRTIAPTCAGGS